jgi:hypothetical protein
MKTIHLFFLSLFIASASFGQQSEEWLTWNSADNTVSISYPKEWTEQKLNAGEVIAFAAPKDNTEDHYPDMIILRAFPDSGAKNIDRFKDFARNTLNPDFKFKISSSQKIVAKDKVYIKTVAEEGDGKVILIMYALLKEDKLYFLTLNIEKRNYERYKSVGDGTVESLEIMRAWIAK